MTNEQIAVLLAAMVWVVFFLGGKLSPLWQFKTYRKFIRSIGLDDE